MFLVIKIISVNKINQELAHGRMSLLMDIRKGQVARTNIIERIEPDIFLIRFRKFRCERRLF